MNPNDDNSFEGFPPPNIYHRPPTLRDAFPLKWIWITAACFLLLFLLGLWVGRYSKAATLVASNKHNQQKANGLQHSKEEFTVPLPTRFDNILPEEDTESDYNARLKNLLTEKDYGQLIKGGAEVDEKPPKALSTSIVSCRSNSLETLFSSATTRVNAARNWIQQQKVTGIVPEGHKSRLVLNDRVYQLGEIVNESYHLQWSGLDPEKKKLYFRDLNGTIYGLDY